MSTETTPTSSAVPVGQVEALTLPLVECFGPTYQGEGPYTGHPATFVRLGHCNLACSWCDTPYSWDGSRYDLATEAPDTGVLDIVENVVTIGAGMTVLTGGEPLLHQRKPAFKELLRNLAARGGPIHCETNGTIYPIAEAAHLISNFSVSLKLSNSGEPEKRRIKPAAVEAWARRATYNGTIFKFVISNDTDLDEVDQLAGRFGIPSHAVWLMPEGTTAEAVLISHRRFADAALTRGYRTTTRLHTLLWNDERGR